MFSSIYLLQSKTLKNIPKKTQVLNFSLHCLYCRLMSHLNELLFLFCTLLFICCSPGFLTPITPLFFSSALNSTLTQPTPSLPSVLASRPVDLMEDMCSDRCVTPSPNRTPFPQDTSSEENSTIWHQIKLNSTSQSDV